MSADARVSRPAEGADRFRPARALAAAAIGLAAGLCVTWLARSDESAASSTSAVSVPEPPSAPVDAAGTTHDVPAAHTDAAVADAPAPARSNEPRDDDAAPVVAAADVATALATDAGAAALARSAARKRSVTLGTVAYLRCDGVELRGGRFPCPRDQTLEAAGWRVLQVLGSCPDADPGTGALEVRLDLAGHEVVGARYLRGEETRLDTSAIERCIGDALSALRTELEPDRMIVSFRLELR